MSYYDDALDRELEVLGTKGRAEEWLDKMSESLGASPRKLLDSKEGFNRVLRHIHSVELANDTD